MTYQQGWYCKVLAIFLIFAMLVAVPFSTVQAYATEDDQPTETFNQGDTFLKINTETDSEGDQDHHGGDFVDEIRSEVVKLDVKTPASAGDENVCAIGDAQYDSLDAALAAIGVGEAKTITLLKNIDHDKGITLDNKKVTFELNGYTLNIVSSLEGVHALVVCNGGGVALSGAGALNVTGPARGCGVRVSSNSMLSEVTVTNVTASGTDAKAAYAYNRASLTVLGDVTATGVGSYGVHVQQGAVIEVLRNVSADHQGVSVSGATAKVAGNVEANEIDSSGNPNGIGINVYNGIAEVGGNVTANWIGAKIRAGGSITIDGILTAPEYIQFTDKTTTPIDGYLETTTKTGYRTYQHEKAGTVWVKEGPNVCAIGDVEYATLGEALREVKNGETIKLLQNITHTDPIKVSEKTINFDLDDYNLMLDISADDSFDPALRVEGGGKVNLIGTGTGQFNVKKDKNTAISIFGVNSEATVDNVEVTNYGRGVDMLGSGYALDGGAITVKGNIKAEKGSGVSVNAKNGKVIVSGNITARNIGVDIASNPNTEVTVNGDITVIDNNEPIGIRAYGKTTVTVNGNLNVMGSDAIGIQALGSTIKVGKNVISSGTGVEAKKNYPYVGNVTIDGSLSAGTPFIVVGTTEKTAADATEPTTKSGFLTYTDGENTVWIGSVGDYAPNYTVTVINGSGTGEYAEGAEVCITAGTPESGKEFKEWTGTDGLTFTEGSKNTATAKFTMPAKNVTVTAIYKDKVVMPDTYTVILNGGGTGATGAGSYAEKEIVNIYAGNRSNYTFAGWTSSDVTITDAGNKNASFTMPAKNVTVTAAWSYNGGGGSSYTGGGSSYTDASLSTTKADFDKFEGKDVTITLNMYSYTLKDLKNGSYTLKKGTDYTVSGSTVTIKAEYLDSLAVGKQVITFDMSGGADPILNITIVDKRTPDTGVHIPFTDVTADDWFVNSVMWAYEADLIKGVSEKSMLFAPHDTMTRGMIVTILHRLESTPESGTTNPFVDVADGKWYAGAVVWAAENKIVSGYGNGWFDPDGPITCEQMAVILMNYAKLKGYDVTARADLSGFADVDTVSDWALEAISWANAAGLILGDGTNLAPTGNAQRCQVAVILQRFVENFAK